MTLKLQKTESTKYILQPPNKIKISNMIPGKSPNIWKLNNILPNKPQFKEEITREIKYLELNENQTKLKYTECSLTTA